MILHPKSRQTRAAPKPDLWPGASAMPGMALLLAQMQAMSVLMPGQQAQSRNDEEVEALFDNMPV